MYVSGEDIPGSEEQSLNNMSWRLIPLSAHKAQCDPKGGIFHYGGCHFMAFFIASIIHNSLIRENNVGTLVFTLQFGCTQVYLCSKLE